MVTRIAMSPAYSLAMEPSPRASGMPSAIIHPARQISIRAASISVAMSASLKAIASWRAIGLPKAWRSRE